MARKTESKDIDGITFTVTQLPAMRSVVLLHKLTKAAGPALLRTIGNFKDLKTLLTSDVSSLADTVQGLFDRFSADDTVALIRELFETATMSVGGKALPIMPVFDEQLAGKPEVILQAVGFALGVNYASFLGGLRAKLSAAAAEASPESKAP